MPELSKGFDGRSSARTPRSMLSISHHNQGDVEVSLHYLPRHLDLPHLWKEPWWV